MAIKVTVRAPEPPPPPPTVSIEGLSGDGVRRLRAILGAVEGLDDELKDLRTSLNSMLTPYDADGEKRYYKATSVIRLVRT